MKIREKSTDDLKILFSNEELTKRIKEIAQTLDKSFEKDEDIYVICVLKGSVMFCTELVKNMKSKIGY